MTARTICKTIGHRVIEYDRDRWMCGRCGSHCFADSEEWYIGWNNWFYYLTRTNWIYYAKASYREWRYGPEDIPI